jgi:hypothetical protein
MTADAKQCAFQNDIIREMLERGCMLGDCLQVRGQGNRSVSRLFQAERALRRSR